uniref:uncharacterized protein LOC120957588 n=1 Tax=Anopheles coluzzii TaxID=1518534 RepID=UPI0020FFB9D2|nr:uncharacterized protein LOC120957588 [Anopheles coluzzii]
MDMFVPVHWNLRTICSSAQPTARAKEGGAKQLQHCFVHSIVWSIRTGLGVSSTSSIVKQFELLAGQFGQEHRFCGATLLRMLLTVAGAVLQPDENPVWPQYTDQSRMFRQWPMEMVDIQQRWVQSPCGCFPQQLI